MQIRQNIVVDLWYYTSSPSLTKSSTNSHSSYVGSGSSRYTSFSFCRFRLFFGGMEAAAAAAAEEAAAAVHPVGDPAAAAVHGTPGGSPGGGGGGARRGNDASGKTT